jgi:hypothetical protein
MRKNTTTFVKSDGSGQDIFGRMRDALLAHCPAGSNCRELTAAINMVRAVQFRDEFPARIILRQ